MRLIPYAAAKWEIVLLIRNKMTTLGALVTDTTRKSHPITTKETLRNAYIKKYLKLSKITKVI